MSASGDTFHDKSRNAEKLDAEHKCNAFAKARRGEWSDKLKPPDGGLQKDLPNNGIFERELVVEDLRLPASRAAFVKKPPAVILETGGGDGEPRNEPPPLDVLRLSESSCLLDVPPEESCSAFLYQVFPTFMLAGAGMVAAGLLLDIVQSWQVFIDVSQLFVLVPALLGLKGNLEMTLASRLSTQAHLGKMDSLMEVLNITCGNMALLQCQSLVVGAMASLYAIVTSLVVFSEDISLRHGILVLSSAVITVSVASFILEGNVVRIDGEVEVGYLLQSTGETRHGQIEEKWGQN
ncbi:hypothetical protein ISCGN_011673 [Ixodes scapularis]